MNEFTAELIGTAFLIILGNGVVANVVLKGTKGHNGGWIVITTGWALAVFVGVVIAAPYSNAHLNPAVTLGLAIAGKFDWGNVGYFILAQMLGAAIGSFIVWIVYKDHFDNTPEPELKLAVFCTSPSIRNSFFNLMSEIVGTFILIFVILYFSAPKLGEQDLGLGSLGYVPVAFLVWSIGLSLGGTTGYAINPARDFAPRIIHSILPMKNKSHGEWKYAWIPVMGPFIGGALAAVVYLLLEK